jgi:hypothetical protein
VPSKQLSTSGSLPSLVPATTEPFLAAPAAPFINASAIPYVREGIEERAMLKRKIKELEHLLKKATATLARERKDHEVFKQEDVQRHQETRRMWQHEMETQLQRAKQQGQNAFSALEEDSKALLQRQSAAAESELQGELERMRDQLKASEAERLSLRQAVDAMRGEAAEAACAQEEQQTNTKEQASGGLFTVTVTKEQATDIEQPRFLVNLSVG